MTSTIVKQLARAVELEPTSDSARLDVELLLADALGKDRTYLYTWPEKQLNDDELLAFQQHLTRRLNGEPVAYILGYQDFWSLRLRVSPATLIPRPETELIVEAALALIDAEDALVADLGTGTGAIALALATEKPRWTIKAIDKVDEAVLLAESNRAALELSNVEVLQGSWCEPLMGMKFDLLASNPPYIDSNDEHLSQGDVRFEPNSALVAEKQGLADIETIVVQAAQCLKAEGWLLLEHGYQQAHEVRQLLLRSGYQSVSSQRDLAGHERLTLGQWLN